MGPKKKTGCSPGQAAAKKIRNRYSCRSPGKRERVRRALYEVTEQKVSVGKAAQTYGLSYSFLYRRVTGEVDIDSRNGRGTIFSMTEEEAMATWLKEMCERGMGLKPGEFLDFVQGVVTKEKRITPFKDSRPSYDWYRGFMNRNSHIIQTRQETPLETCRAKLSRTQIDQWFNKYRDFVVSKGLLEKRSRIFNADESGFAMGSKSGKVIGPLKSQSPQVPHVSGGHSKQRLTVMFAGCADGTMLPPFLVYPTPKPRGYNPLSGGLENSGIVYTTKGWMDSVAFQEFLHHFDRYCGQERPVILLIDSVSSHINIGAFEYAKSKGIELYRLVPNATHILQPLDKGVFGPLKKKWYEVLRSHSRDNPGAAVGKEQFASLLKDAFLRFYKPLTVINSFKSTGLYPVDSTVITSTMLKPGLTFTGEEECGKPVTPKASEKGPDSDSLGALNALESVLTTPIRAKYKQRIEEKYNLEGVSPCFDAYRKLYLRSQGTSPSQAADATASSVLSEQQAATATATSVLSEQQAATATATSVLTEQQAATATASSVLSDDVNTDCCSEQPQDSASTDMSSNTQCSSRKVSGLTSGLNLLATVCADIEIELAQETGPVTYSPPCVNLTETVPVCSTESPDILNISPVLQKSLVFPKSVTNKQKRKTLVQEIPDNLTSPEAIRKMALKELDKVRQFARKEQRAKINFLKQQSTQAPAPKKRKVSKRQVKKNIPQSNNQIKTKQTQKVHTVQSDDATCMGCDMSWTEDQALESGSVWIQCDDCDRWIHRECCGDSVDVQLSASTDAHFSCPECLKRK